MTNEEYAVAIRAGHTEYIAPLWENVEKLLRCFCVKWWSVYSERFTRYGVTQDDLMQESFFALRDAVAAYDSSSGYKLSTYLRYPIQNRFNALLGRRSYNRTNPLNDCGSLNALIGDDEDCELIELLPDPCSEQPFRDTERNDYIAYWHNELDKAMQRRLDKQQRDVVYDAYYARLPRSVIAEKHGLTLRDVHRILQKSLTELRRDHELWQRYRDEIIRDGLYKGTGLNAFRNSGMSSKERSVERIEQELDRLSKDLSAADEVSRSLLQKEHEVMQKTLDSLRRYRELEQNVNSSLHFRDIHKAHTSD